MLETPQVRYALPAPPQERSHNAELMKLAGKMGQLKGELRARQQPLSELRGQLGELRARAPRDEAMRTPGSAMRTPAASPSALPRGFSKMNRQDLGDLATTLGVRPKREYESVADFRSRVRDNIAPPAAAADPEDGDW